MQVRELDVKFIKFLLNLKAINYLKNKKMQLGFAYMNYFY